MIAKSSQSASTSTRAAMFVDYENLYTVLTSQSSTNNRTGDYASEILDEVCRYLEEGDDTPTIYGRAYGAFDNLLSPEDAEVPSNLHRAGIEPVYVPAAMQKNTSEVRLSLDVPRFLSDRPDIQTVVLVTGDRPYLPLVRFIREQGRRALVAAVNPPHTDGAPSFVEDDLYLDARNLLSQPSRDDLLANAPEKGEAYEDAARGTPPPRRYRPLENAVARRTIEITEEHFGQYEEVYLTPLLRKLSDILGPDHDPKALVSELEAAGAVRLEKRNGYPYDYTVLIVNDDHPDVQEIHEKRSTSGSSPSRDDDASTASSSLPSTESASESESGVPEDADAYDHDAYAMDDALSSEPNEDDPERWGSTEDSAEEGSDSDEATDAVEDDQAPIGEESR